MLITNLDPGFGPRYIHHGAEPNSGATSSSADTDFSFLFLTGWISGLFEDAFLGRPGNLGMIDRNKTLSTMSSWLVEYPW